MRRIHMNGRVYDPGLGRFLSVDPVFQFPENTQSLNPYTYVLNSPLTFTDPTGLAMTEADWLAFRLRKESMFAFVNSNKKRNRLQAKLDELKGYAGIGQVNDTSELGALRQRAKAFFAEADAVLGLAEDFENWATDSDNGGTGPMKIEMSSVEGPATFSMDNSAAKAAAETTSSQLREGTPMAKLTREAISTARLITSQAIHALVKGDRNVDAMMLRWFGVNARHYGSHMTARLQRIRDFVSTTMPARLFWVHNWTGKRETVAWVNQENQRTFLTSAFFSSNYDAVERARILIHEAAHLPGVGDADLPEEEWMYGPVSSRWLASYNQRHAMRHADNVAYFAVELSGQRTY